MKKKTILWLLLSAMLTSLAACGGGETSETTSTDTTPAETSAETETEDLMKDNLPEKDYGGYEFRIFSRAQPWFHGEWLAAEQTGAGLNDAIWTRNAAVGERFNVTFSEQTDTSSDVVRNAILAGSDAYDLVNTRCSIVWNYAEEGLLLDLSALPAIDLTRGYWDASLNDCLSIGDKMYFAVGSSNITGYDYTHVLTFNKAMIADNGLESPYDLVKEGQWTLDSFQKMTSNVTVDVDGDGAFTDADSYGFLAQAKAVLPGFWIGCDVLSINKNADNEPVFTMPTDTRFLDVFEKVYQLTWDNGSWFVHLEATNYDDKLTGMFQENKGLFMDITFFYIEALRDMEQDFGILPYPKFDEAQSAYLSRIEGCELSGVPITTQDAERTSIVLEALASESADTVVKAYYDVALKGKYTRDNESAEMLDIIFEGRVFDLGDTIWCDDLRDGVFKGMFGENDRAIASKFASIQEKVDVKLATTIEAFGK